MGPVRVLAKATPERLGVFSDGVLAVLITVLVLELRTPAVPTYMALLESWPEWLSYALSFIFLAIVWINHHQLLRHATQATPRLLWFNFVHLFSISLVPFSTAWMATSRFAPQPVSFYAAVFFLMNATYIAMVWELTGESHGAAPTATTRMIRQRSVITLFLFATAAIVALVQPIIGLSICVGCLLFYVKPEQTWRQAAT